jgi:hypothetical protein
MVFINMATQRLGEQNLIQLVAGGLGATDRARQEDQLFTLYLSLVQDE